MVSYFIPISLMVLSGFALGLLVGRLAWGSTESVTDREPEESTGPNEEQEAASTSPGEAVQEPTQDLPVWWMKEVH